MSQSAHYVTQSSIYDCPKLGRLTNRRIEEYRRRGYYSTGFADERRERMEKKPKGSTAATRAKKFLASLLE